MSCCQLYHKPTGLPVYTCVYKMPIAFSEPNSLYLAAIFVLSHPSQHSIPCLKAIFLSSLSCEYLKKMFQLPSSNFVHTSVSMYNANVYEVLSDSHKYFAFANYIFSFTPMIIEVLLFGSHICFYKAYKC